MLAIKVGQRCYSLLGQQILQIEYADAVTALPCTRPPLDGLVEFNAQPLLQIDVAAALGLASTPRPTSKRLIVDSQYGCFALRVDEVARGANTKTATTPLPLASILPHLPATRQPAVSLARPKPPAPVVETPTFTVLWVVADGRTVGLSTHNIARIVEISGSPPSAELLIRLDQQLIPVHSLARLLQAKDSGGEPYAVVVRGRQAAWALAVQRVAGMATLTQAYAFDGGFYRAIPAQRLQALWDDSRMANGGDPIPRLWHVDRDGQAQELVDADYLLAQPCPPQTISIVAAPIASSRPLPCNASGPLGVRVGCGGERYFLPLAMVVRLVDNLDVSAMSRSRVTARHPARARWIPWLDASALLFGRRATSIRHTVVVTLANGGRILLGVDDVQLSQVKAAENWVPVALPEPLTRLFDGACYDQAVGKWTLRVAVALQWADWPWALKKALAKAVVGWFERSD